MGHKLNSTVIFLVISFFILKSGGGNLPFCNIEIIKNSLPPLIFANQTVDGQSQSILTTRFFHNKLGIMSSQFSQCYFNALDLYYIFSSLTIFGLFTFIYFIYKILISKKTYLILPVLVLPALPVFGLGTAIMVFMYKIFAIIGLAFLLKNIL